LNPPVTPSSLWPRACIWRPSDGRPYLYEMNAEAMLDVLEEAYDAKVAARK
jgi:hypothetical protein